ncbi:MAG: hypothetical protein ABW007_27920 [Chitinophagaceae bacterium]
MFGRSGLRYDSAGEVVILGILRSFRIHFQYQSIFFRINKKTACSVKEMILRHLLLGRPEQDEEASHIADFGSVDRVVDVAGVATGFAVDYYFQSKASMANYTVTISSNIREGKKGTVIVHPLEDGGTFE